MDHSIHSRSWGFFCSKLRNAPCDVTCPRIFTAELGWASLSIWMYFSGPGWVEEDNWPNESLVHRSGGTPLHQCPVWWLPEKKSWSIQRCMEVRSQYLLYPKFMFGDLIMSGYLQYSSGSKYFLPCVTLELFCHTNSTRSLMHLDDSLKMCSIKHLVS